MLSGTLLKVCRTYWSCRGKWLGAGGAGTRLCGEDRAGDASPAAPARCAPTRLSRITTSSTCSRRSSPRPPPSTRPTPRRSSSHAPRSPASPTSARVRTLGTPVGPSPAADGRRLAAAQPARDARCAHAPRPTATPNPVPADSSTVHPIRLSLHSQSAQIRIVISEAPHSV